MRPVTVIEAGPLDMEALIADIRPEDAAELHLAQWTSVRSAVESCVSRSTVFRAMYIGDELACLFGIADVTALGDTACIWTLGTNAIRRHPREYLRACRKAAKEAMDLLPQVTTFYNWMPVHFSTYITWAERYFGARFDEAGTDGFRRLSIQKGA